ncbi:molybdopterin dinucleotide binding domain-containing protein [Chloroflexota bacterium]
MVRDKVIKSTCGLSSIGCGVLVYVDKELGITNGDWVYIETKRGRIKQKTTLSADINPRVIVVDYGW